MKAARELQQRLLPLAQKNSAPYGVAGEMWPATCRTVACRGRRVSAAKILSGSDAGSRGERGGTSPCFPRALRVGENSILSPAADGRRCRRAVRPRWQHLLNLRRFAPGYLPALARRGELACIDAVP